MVKQSMTGERIDSILNSHGVKSLNVIFMEDLMKFYNITEPINAKIKLDFSEGISPPNDYYFLVFLAKALNVKKYFEIGTWLGLSAINISQNTNNDTEIYTLDIPFDHPEIKIFNIPEKVFGFFSKDDKRIKHLKFDSKSFNYQNYKKQFELVFVDGNHSFDYVKNDTRMALELLKDENSIIAWHDYILSGELNKTVLAGILEAIPKEEHKHLVYLHQSDLALYSKSFNFSAKDLSDWYIAKYYFELSMNAKPLD